MTERPRPERETTQRQLVADYRYTYTGYWSRDAVCCIQVFAVPDDVPVVVATELDENTGTSITNVCEYLAAEVIALKPFSQERRPRSVSCSLLLSSR